MNKKLIFIFLLIVLTWYVYAEKHDLGYKINGAVEVDIKEDGSITFNFIEENGEVCIKGNCFTNIAPPKTIPNFIELNETGEIIKAGFTVDEKGGTYNLGGSTFYAPPGSRVIYEYNSESEEPPKITLGEKIKRVEIGDEFLSKRPVIYGGYKGGDFVLSIDGIENKVSDDLWISYEENFDPSKVSENQNILNLREDGMDFIGDYTAIIKRYGESLHPHNKEGSKIFDGFDEEKRHLKFILNGGSVIVTNTKTNGPIFLEITARGDVRIENGEVYFEPDENEFYIGSIGNSKFSELDKLFGANVKFNEKTYHLPARPNSIVQSSLVITPGGNLVDINYGGNLVDSNFRVFA